MNYLMSRINREFLSLDGGERLRPKETISGLWAYPPDCLEFSWLQHTDRAILEMLPTSTETIEFVSHDINSLIPQVPE